MNIKVFILIVCTIVSLNTSAQKTNNFIRLLDSDTHSPIVGATFSYSNSTGTSDANGIIHFNFTEDTTMKVSHLNYGVWQINNHELKEVINQNYYRQSINIELFPVTIIQVKSHHTEHDEIAIQYKDRLEHDGAALLTQIPAIGGIKKSGSYGYDPVFRGFKYEQLNIVINGSQSASAACPNRMDPPTSQISPNMMDRIEIMKGPYALRYGAGIGATINFIPSELKHSDVNKFYGRASTGNATNGNILRGEINLGNRTKYTDFGIYGSWSKGNDYTSGDGTTIQSNFQRASFGANLGVKISEVQELRLSFTNNRAYDTDFPALAMDLRSDNTYLVNAQHEIKFIDKSLKSINTSVYGSFVDHLMDNLLKPLNPRMINAEATANTLNYGFRSEGSWIVNVHKLYFGVDYKVEQADGLRTREFLMGSMTGMLAKDNIWQDSKITKSAVFAEFQYNTEKVKYVVSSRLELNEGHAADLDEKFLETYLETDVLQFNPSISAGISVPINSSIKTALWIGSVKRSAGLAERYINYFPIGLDPYELVGNPQLKPEINNQIDLTFDWKTTRTSVNVDLFATYLKDYISSTIDTTLNPKLPMSPGVRQFSNIDAAFKTGFEIDWQQHLIWNLKHELSIAYTFGKNIELNTPLPEVAPFEIQYIIWGSYFKAKLQPEVKIRHAAQQNRVAEEFGENSTPAFTTVDLKLSFHFTKNFACSAGAQNLLNANYFEHLTRNLSASTTPIYMPGRNIYFNLSYKF